jgi:2-phospho-L-lactate guanylyltransferase
MRTAVVLPVKRFTAAKQRLGEAVGGEDRRELAAAMVGDVLQALAAVDAVDEVLVVTAEEQAAEAATHAGAVVVHDPAEAGQSAAAEVGVRIVRERGAERALLVPGDCPALDPAEIDVLLARYAAPAPAVAIVPDRHGRGTNALLLTPPEALAPAFGPGSLARHAARASAAGALVKVAQAPSLELDVDTPGDLAALREALSRRPGAAPRTRRVLERLFPAPAPAAR